MARASTSKIDKIEHPQKHYKTPNDVIRDQELSPTQKRKALVIWEQDAHQLLTASNEGMPGSDEGVKKSDHPQLGEVERAKGKLGDKPASKAAH